MAKPVVVHPNARAESDNAFAWYEARNPQAAQRFSAEVQRAYRQIGENPDLFSAYPHGPGRYVQLTTFPYAIIYAEHDNHVGIYAVAHTSRKPGYWSERVTQ